MPTRRPTPPGPTRPVSRPDFAAAFPRANLGDATPPIEFRLVGSVRTEFSGSLGICDDAFSWGTQRFDSATLHYRKLQICKTAATGLEGGAVSVDEGADTRLPGLPENAAGLVTDTSEHFATGVFSGTDGAIRVGLWDIARHALLASVPKAVTEPGSPTIATVRSDGTVYYWEWLTLLSLNARGDWALLRSAANGLCGGDHVETAQGRFATVQVAGSQGGTGRLLDLVAHQDLGAIAGMCNIASVGLLRVARDRRRFLVDDSRRVFTMRWDGQSFVTETALDGRAASEENPARQMWIAPDGQTAFVAHRYDGTLEIYRANAGPSRRYALPAPPHAPGGFVPYGTVGAIPAEGDPSTLGARGAWQQFNRDNGQGDITWSLEDSATYGDVGDPLDWGAAVLDREFRGAPRTPASGVSCGDFGQGFGCGGICASVQGGARIAVRTERSCEGHPYLRVQVAALLVGGNVLHRISLLVSARPDAAHALAAELLGQVGIGPIAEALFVPPQSCQPAPCMMQ